MSMQRRYSRLPNNSRYTTSEPKRTREPVVSGRVSAERRSNVAEKVRDAGNTLFGTIVMPMMKDIIRDFLTTAVHMVLYGSDGVQRPTSRSVHTNYSSLSRRPRQTTTVRSVKSAYEDVFFEHHHDASSVLSMMQNYVADYGVATVGDLYSLAGLRADSVAERWGWDNLTRVAIYQAGSDWVIDFPEPLPIED